MHRRPGAIKLKASSCLSPHGRNVSSTGSAGTTGRFTDSKSVGSCWLRRRLRARLRAGLDRRLAGRLRAWLEVAPTKTEISRFKGTRSAGATVAKTKTEAGRGMVWLVGLRARLLRSPYYIIIYVHIWWTNGVLSSLQLGHNNHHQMYLDVCVCRH